MAKSGEPKVTLSDFVRVQRDGIKSYREAWLAGQKDQGTGAYPRKMTMTEWNDNFQQYIASLNEQPAQAAE